MEGNRTTIMIEKFYLSAYREQIQDVHVIFWMLTYEDLLIEAPQSKIKCWGFVISDNLKFWFVINTLAKKDQHLSQIPIYRECSVI